MTLFTQASLSDFKVHMDLYLLHLSEYTCQLGSEFKTHGIFIASCNFAAIFQYGSTDAVIPNEFKESLAQDKTSLTALKNWTPVYNSDAIEAESYEFRIHNPKKIRPIMVLISPSRLPLLYWIIFATRCLSSRAGVLGLYLVHGPQ